MLDRVASARHLQDTEQRLIDWLQEYHRKYPDA